MLVANLLRKHLPISPLRLLFGTAKDAKESKSLEPNFLVMVESYFDKAAKQTSIAADRLNLYKKSECVIKFHLTLKRGKDEVTQTTA
jgi:hypothetical protein